MTAISFERMESVCNMTGISPRVEPGSIAGHGADLVSTGSSGRNLREAISQSKIGE
jgi:hypothetical protein